MDYLIYVVIFSGIAIDLLSCFLNIRRVMYGRGASGLIGVSLILCYFLPLISIKNPIVTKYYFLDFLILFFVHIFLVIIIPRIYKSHKVC